MANKNITKIRNKLIRMMTNIRRNQQYDENKDMIRQYVNDQQEYREDKEQFGKNDDQLEKESAIC